MNKLLIACTLVFATPTALATMPTSLYAQAQSTSTTTTTERQEDTGVTSAGTTGEESMGQDLDQAATGTESVTRKRQFPWGLLGLLGLLGLAGRNRH